jgi:histidine phosphotransferase ChpT
MLDHTIESTTNNIIAMKPLQGSKLMLDTSKLAEMLCTRLCHDLTGPIGAVNNGAEFLEDEGFEMHNEAMQLVLSSALEAVNRLQFYRQAYGHASDSGDICLADKKATCEAFFSTTKVKLDWPDTHTDASGVSFNQKMGRLLMNMLIIGAQSLIRGGVIEVRIHENDGLKTIQMNAKGEYIKYDDDTKAILNGDFSKKLSPKLAQLYLTMHLVDEIGANIAVSVQEDSFSLCVTQQAVADIHMDVTTG